MSKWTKISAAHPTDYSYAIASKRGVGCFLLESDFEEIVVWSYKQGQWNEEPRIARDIGSEFAMLYDDGIGDFVVFHSDSNEGVVYRFCLGDPERVQVLRHPEIESTGYPESFSVAYHQAESRSYLLFHYFLMRVDGSWDDEEPEVKMLLEDDMLEDWKIGYDPQSARVFAMRPSESYLQFPEGDEMEDGDWTTKEMLSTAVYSQKRGALCVLAGVRVDEDDTEALEESYGMLQLQELHEDEWQPASLFFDAKDSLNTRLTLLEDPDAGSLLAYGSMDTDGSDSYQVTLVEDGEHFVRLANAEHHRAPSTTLSHTAEHLFLHDHSNGNSLRLNPATQSWEPLWPPNTDHELRVLSRDAMVCTDAEGTHYALDAHGALHRREAHPEAEWSRLAEAEGGPGGTHLNRKCMGWDPKGERIIVFGGYDDDRTHAFQEGSWVVLASEQRPGLGLGSMATTPEGLYLACYGELWRLHGDQWECVAQIPSDDEDDFHKQSIRHSLCHDPNRSLFLASYEREGEGWIGWLDPEGEWNDLLALPEGISAAHLGDLSVDLGLAPTGDLLYLMGVDQAYRVSLQDFDLPEGALPTEGGESVNQLPDPPESALVAAMRLAKAEGGATYDPHELELPFSLPKEAKVLAILPYHPEMNCGSQWFDALAFIDCDDDSFSPDTPIEPIAEYMKYIKIIPIKGWTQEQPLFTYDYDNHLTEARWLPFKELEPQPSGKRIYKMTDADRYAEGSKLGGYARYFRRISGPEFERISIQLESEKALNRIYVRLWHDGGEFDIEKL